MTDRPWADPDRLAAIEAQTEPDSVLPRIWAATDLVDPKPIRWLAQGRIPEGVVTILVGDEGIGKSLFWVWIAAIVTTGRAAPEYGIPGGPARPVLLVLTEDDWASIARPRLEAAAADLDLVSLICVEPDGTGTPEFPRDMHLIRDLDPAPALIVVDAFIDTNGLHPKTGAQLNVQRPRDARIALHPWTQAATSTGAAVLLVTHTNRMAAANARDRYGITSELRKKARMTLYAQRPENEPLSIGPEKSNLTRLTMASTFAIEAVQFWEPTPSDDGTVPKLIWTGESTMTAQQHLTAASEAQDDDLSRPKLDEAERWLYDFLLKEGLVMSQKAKTEAKKVGVSEATLKRAAQALQVTIRSEGFPRVTFWQLPSDASDAGA